MSNGQAGRLFTGEQAEGSQDVWSLKNISESDPDTGQLGW